ncbi:MAG: hypothetical protein RMY62_014715 [Nostoc sp. ZfuVER08]|nr:hypothetical protein [Nostoc sp. ZfuVER08]
MLNRLVHIQEPGIDRIINLNDVCSATKTGTTLFIFMVNNAQPLIFREQAAENLWRILMNSSLTVYSAEKQPAAIEVTKQPNTFSQTLTTQNNE